MEDSRLLQEVHDAETFRDTHLGEYRTMVDRYTGPDFTGSTGDINDYDPANSMFEYVSLVLPRLIYDNPTCRVTSRRPIQQRMTAEKMQLALNLWCKSTGFRDTMQQIAVDSFFAWGIALTRNEPMMGQSMSSDDPQYLPKVYRINPEHFFVDPASMDLMNCKYMGHKYVSSKADLLAIAEKDKTYNKETIEKIAEGSGVSDARQGYQSSYAGYRDEIAVYEVWIPSSKPSKNGKFHGKIYTFAMNSEAYGSEATDKDYGQIREPVDYYGPRTGPYSIFGFYTVPNNPYPLSPLVASNPIIRDLNNHYRAITYGAGAYKRLVLVDSKNRQLPQQIKDSPDLFVVPVDSLDGDRVVPLEIGGITQQQLAYVNDLQQRIDKLSGMSEVHRGNISGDATATEVSVAESASGMRMAHMQRQFRSALERIMKSVAWYLFHDDRVQLPLGQEGIDLLAEVDPVFKGGSGAGNYEDLDLEIDPYSVEKTNQASQQRRATEVIGLIGNLSPLIPQAPYVDWPKLIDYLGQSLNMPELGNIIDMQGAAQAGQEQMMMGGGQSFGGINMNGIPNPTAGNVSGSMSPSGPVAEARREARRNR